jgi:hypothetical protein
MNRGGVGARSLNIELHASENRTGICCSACLYRQCACWVAHNADRVQQRLSTSVRIAQLALPDTPGD